MVEYKYKKLKMVFPITFFVMMCISISVNAQGLSVDKFVALEEATATLPATAVKDSNGRNAALIKIVTLEQGFIFEGGAMGIVATKPKTGEIWLYVPDAAEKLTIKHQAFGVLREYYYPIPIEGGRTYEMLLNIGTGRYVTITSSITNSDITIDGEYVGKAPLYNRYLNYGRHNISAVNGRFEGKTEAIVTINDEQKNGRIIAVDMRDMSDHFGTITVNVAGKADIYFNGRHVGTGSWTDQLREGNYDVETRKINCESVKTQFTVVAQQENTIEATPPVPHTGKLHLYTRPHSVVATYNGTHPLDLTEAQTLPVGTYQVGFFRKGYVSQNHDYTIHKGEIVCDTVQLERVTYIKPKAFYFGGAFTLRNLSGISAILGATIKKHDIQVGYTFGIIKSKDAYWYDTNGNFQSDMKYKLNSITVKYGYQFPLVSRLALVPQVGYSYNFLTGSLVSGSKKYGSGASAHCASVGLKLLVVPVQHCYIFLAPEYDFAINKDDKFKVISNAADFSASTFAVSVGVLVNF